MAQIDPNNLSGEDFTRLNFLVQNAEIRKRELEVAIKAHAIRKEEVRIKNEGRGSAGTSSNVFSSIASGFAEGWREGGDEEYIGADPAEREPILFDFNIQESTWGDYLRIRRVIFGEFRYVALESQANAIKEQNRTSSYDEAFILLSRQAGLQEELDFSDLIHRLEQAGATPEPGESSENRDALNRYKELEATHLDLEKSERWGRRLSIFKPRWKKSSLLFLGVAVCAFLLHFPSVGLFCIVAAAYLHLVLFLIAVAIVLGVLTSLLGS